MHPVNAVMLPRDQPHHAVSDRGIFIVIHIVDARDVVADARKQALPIAFLTDFRASC